MTQKQYLQSMASICGDALPASATTTNLVDWARSKGMYPNAGWHLEARLTKDVMAQTLVQLLKLPPGKGNSDPVEILQREGITIPSSGRYVTAQAFVQVIDKSFTCRAKPNRGGDDDDDGGGGRRDDDDGPSRDDDDGPRPTPTKPGHGHGDKNHDHTGPPGHGHGVKPPKKGHSDDN